MSAPHSRASLETLLQQRRLDGTLTRRLPETGRLETGVQTLDAQLEGGVPRGHVSEVVGPRSSGRSRLLLTLLAAATQGGEVAAWVDTVDRGDPALAAAAGVRLSQVLWIRGMALSPGELALRPTRDEAADLAGLALQRALKATALVTQAGGFGLVALDLCDMPATTLRQVPPSTWMRLHRQVEGRETALVLLTAHPVTRSAGGWSLRLEATPQWEGDSARVRRLAVLASTYTVHSARHPVATSLESRVARAG
jgi:hypothetical protein